MQKPVLLYNPLSGGRRGRRLADVEAAAAVLQSGGVEVSIAPTRAAADAAEQVREAIAEGCDTVFACGGDGTIHDVLQGLATTQAALGIIPLERPTLLPTICAFRLPRLGRPAAPSAPLAGEWQWAKMRNWIFAARHV